MKTWTISGILRIAMRGSMGNVYELLKVCLNDVKVNKLSKQHF